MEYSTLISTLKVLKILKQKKYRDLTRHFIKLLLLTFYLNHQSSIGLITFIPLHNIYGR